MPSNRLYARYGLGAIGLSASLIAASAETPVYILEQAGTVVFEAESVTAGADWSLENSISGYSGSGYYIYRGNEYFSEQNAGNGDTLQYHIRITTPGNYQLRWRSTIGLGESSTEANDSWVRFPSGQNVAAEEPLDGWTKVYMNRLGAWSWDAKTVDHVGSPIRQYLTAGDHLLEVSGRSDGHAIDRIVLYKYDEVAYSQNKFNTLELSPTTTGPDPLEPPTEPPTAVPALPAEHETDAGQCVAQTLSLAPTVDVSTTPTGVVDDPDLLVSGDETVALLRYDLRALPIEVESVTLQFHPVSETRSVTVMAYAGTHANWDSATAVDQLPGAAVSLGEATFDLTQNGFRELDLTASALSRDYETLVLSLADNSSAVTIHSSSQDLDPRLYIHGGDGFCDEYTMNLEALNAPEPEPTPEPAPTPAPESTPAPVTNTPATDTASSDSGAGALHALLVVLLMGTTLSRRRHR